MSKELEALERLYCAGRLDLDYVLSPKHKEDYNLIENALKENEGLEMQVSTLEVIYDRLADKYHKLYKAVQIIKREPSAVIEIITTYDTWEEYTNDYPLSDKTIWHIIKNKSEFDLLKEIFDE